MVFTIHRQVHFTAYLEISAWVFSLFPLLHFGRLLVCVQVGQGGPWKCSLIYNVEDIKKMQFEHFSKLWSSSFCVFYKSDCRTMWSTVSPCVNRCISDKSDDRHGRNMSHLISYLCVTTNSISIFLTCWSDVEDNDMTTWRRNPDGS